MEWGRVISAPEQRCRYSEECTEEVGFDGLRAKLPPSCSIIPSSFAGEDRKLRAEIKQRDSLPIIVTGKTDWRKK